MGFYSEKRMNKIAALLDMMEVYNLLAFARKIHGPYLRQDGRSIVIIKEDDGVSHTVSYPKHLVQEHIGYELDDNLTIDHWDSNKDNNSLDNLKIIDRREHSANDTRRVKLVKFKCAWCKKKFERSPRLIRDKAKKGKSGPFCSRSCAGKYSRNLQLKLIDKYDCQQSVDSKYYKRKYLKEPKNFS